jgi:Putative Ig domain
MKTEGTLPRGLRLSQDGVLSGAVHAKDHAEDESFTFTVKVTDHTRKDHQTATTTLTLHVN